jgi:hypothetical protein
LPGGAAAVVVVACGTVEDVVVVSGAMVVTGAMVIVGAVVVAGTASLGVQAVANSARAMAMDPSRDMKPEDTAGPTVLASDGATYGANGRQNG